VNVAHPRRRLHMAVVQPIAELIGRNSQARSGDLQARQRHGVHAIGRMMIDTVMGHMRIGTVMRIRVGGRTPSHQGGGCNGGNDKFAHGRSFQSWPFGHSVGSGAVSIVGSRHLETWETETRRVSILSQANASEKTEIGHALMSKRFSVGVSEGLKFARPKGLRTDRHCFGPHGPLRTRPAKKILSSQGVRFSVCPARLWLREPLAVLV